MPVGNLAVRIFVRTDVDWRRMGRADFVNQSDPTRPLAFISSGPIDIWNQAFAMDFFSYRARLQEIAFSTFRDAGADAMTVGFGDFESWWECDDDEMIIPIDDDDLMIGPLRPLVNYLDEDACLALWPRAALILQGDGIMRWRCPTMRCIFATNCALRKSFLKHHFSGEEAVHILADHSVANERLAGVLGLPPDDMALPGFRRLRHPRVSFLPRSFSLKIGHVGSIQLLVRTMRRADPIGYLRSLTLGVQEPIPQYAAPLAASLRALEEVWVSLRPGRDERVSGVPPG
jgi:hypothetical protein